MSRNAKPFCIAVLVSALAGSAAAGAAAAATEQDKYRACVHQTQRAPEEAFESALAWRDNGGGFPARHCVALALVALKRYGQAAEKLENLALDMKAAGPEQQTAMLAQAGNAWMLAGHFRRAHDVFSTALEFAAEDVDLLIDRARASAELSDMRAAFDDLDRAVALNPVRDDALALRAAARRRIGDFGRALEDAEMALAINGNNPEALLERGALRRRAGDKAGARADWLRVATDHANTPAGDEAQARLEELDLNPD
jgi:tetratricopeptide (TPR) repeat protein